jgi:hypothetical protein
MGLKPQDCTSLHKDRPTTEPTEEGPPALTLPAITQADCLHPGTEGVAVKVVQVYHGNNIACN